MNKLAVLIGAAGTAVMAAIPSTVLAQTVEVSAQSRDIHVGLPFAIAITASGFDNEPEPEAPTLKIKDCDVVFAGATPRTMRSISIIGGRRTVVAETSFIFRYQVTPRRAGTFQIPPLQVSQGKKTARSSQRTFSAKPVPATDKMHLVLGLPERPVWLGESFEVVIDWYLNADPSQPTFYIPMFKDADRFTVRAPETAKPSRRRQVVSFPTTGQSLELPYQSEPATLDGKRYTRLRFRALVTPRTSGLLELAPAHVIAALETGTTRDRFGFPVSKSETFSAHDQPRTLEVKPLPQQGRPPGFNNAVGTGFSIDVTASRTVVRVGDPIELTVTVRSESRLGGMALPPSSALLDPSQFALPEEDVIGELKEDGKTKIFRLTAQLKSPDVREVPPLELAYFNPVTATYQVARSRPIALQVAGAAMIGASQVTRNGGDDRSRDNNNGKSDQAQTITLIGADLALSNPTRTLARPAEVRRWLPMLAALYTIPLLLLATLWWRKRTAGARATSGAKRLRTSAFDRAIANASSVTATEAATEIAAALRKIAKDGDGNKNSELEQILAELELEAYNPQATSTTLSKALIEQAQRVAKNIGSKLATLVLIASTSLATHVISMRAAEAAEPAVTTVKKTTGADSSRDPLELAGIREIYQQALASQDSDEARHLYARAATAFAEAVKQTPDRPELLADWGNASLGAHELGWAVLAYRRALRLDPSQPRALTNLNWVRDQLPDWAATDPSSGAVSTLFFWRDSPALTLHMIAALAFATMIFLLVPFGGQGPKMWRWVGSGLCAIVFILTIVPALYRPDDQNAAVVVRDAETLRAADSSSAPDALSRPLPAGAEVTVIESRQRWQQIELANGQRGWLPRTALQRVKP